MGSGDSNPTANTRCDQPLVADYAASIDAHSIADSQAVEVVLLEGALAPIPEAHDDTIALVVVPLLDLVAGHGPADRARGRGDVVAASAADLVAQHAADDAADDGARAARVP